MGLTNGRQKAQEAVMDTIAIASRVRGSIGAMVILTDTAISKDVQDDPLLQNADDSLRSALELTNPVDIHSTITRARKALIDAKEIDFRDMSLGALRAMLVELQATAEKAEERGRELMETLSKTET